MGIVTDSIYFFRSTLNRRHLRNNRRTSSLNSESTQPSSPYSTGPAPILPQATALPPDTPSCSPEPIPTVLRATSPDTPPYSYANPTSTPDTPSCSLNADPTPNLPQATARPPPDTPPYSPNYFPPPLEEEMQTVGGVGESGHGNHTPLHSPKMM